MIRSVLVAIAVIAALPVLWPAYVLYVGYTYGRNAPDDPVLLLAAVCVAEVLWIMVLALVVR